MMNRKALASQAVMHVCNSKRSLLLEVSIYCRWWHPLLIIWIASSIWVKFLERTGIEATQSFARIPRGDVNTAGQNSDNLLENSECNAMLTLGHCDTRFIVSSR